jgi:hypothetical protein
MSFTCLCIAAINGSSIISASLQFPGCRRISCTLQSLRLAAFLTLWNQSHDLVQSSQINVQVDPFHSYFLEWIELFFILLVELDAGFLAFANLSENSYVLLV